MEKLTILLVDDQKLFVSSLKNVLETHYSHVVVVGICHSGREAVNFCTHTLPDIVLMDVRMPDMDGVEATEALLKQYPSLKIVMLTTFNEDQYVQKALRLGAKGYLLKDMLPGELYSAIQSVMNGAVSISPAVMQSSLLRETSEMFPDWFNDLTRKELEILRLIAHGYDNQEIADMVHLAKQTVKNYVSVLYEKIDVRDRMQAMRLCIELKLFEE